MKKVFCAVLLLVGVISFSYAQCGKTVVLNSSKTEYLDASGTVQRTVDEKTIVEISKTEITVIPGDEEQKISGKILSDTCEWRLPFKEGKSVIRALLSDPRGDTKNMTFTIEGKEGVITLIAVLDDMPDRKIKVVLDKYEEKK
ncbi:MAG TPA: hypothetical protein VM012_14125 [Flavitalea sp.]|nr:hypothetical protein [Flavitalea sp.]